MPSMPTTEGRPSFDNMKKRKAPLKMATKTVTITSAPRLVPRLSSSAPISRSIPISESPKPTSNGHSRTTSKPRKSSTPISGSSRQGSKEPVQRIKKDQQSRTKQSSPARYTPLESDKSEGEDDGVDKPRKRTRLEPEKEIDEKRKVRDVQAFSQDDDGGFHMIHAYDIANNKPDEHGRTKYEAFFTALNVEEEECPTIELQYPTSLQAEKYQLVKPTDAADFRPIGEIQENIKFMAAYYLDSASAEKVHSEYGSGIVQKLLSHAKAGKNGKVGHQSQFVELVNQFNALLAEKRRDGTIARKVDQMRRVDLPLVNHIIKNQIYARTVSPRVNLVRQYEGFSDNVYGELLPKFLNKIFEETRLRSDQVFVDLGSGVGNCVLQAALETGCESWGCEMMKNCHALADLQATEFAARCRLWGIKPGRIRLIHGDFLENREIREVLKRADVVLINNQAFTAKLNNSLTQVILDLKEGCQIVSLKPFRSPTHQIKTTNVNDPINVLQVTEKDRFSAMVSWTDDSGYWYLQRKDGRELQAFMERHGGFEKC
ncbi:Nucleosomal histone H3-Lys79 methylase [Cladophialophora chaetospira]|uniref:Histone-lysine N-methyltransferase, H3 lysine-79 specific n=1 Tax=Cladophialophora chaetospira TaxID=386627 RepID=A0AA38WXE4_9EURO|nr:Nucleosomal histone H3-Lys79 methylase [Cladophialophora chaetospira]